MKNVLYCVLDRKLMEWSDLGQKMAFFGEKCEICRPWMVALKNTHAKNFGFIFYQNFKCSYNVEYFENPKDKVPIFWRFSSF